MHKLLNNLDRLHTTELGTLRIKRNLKIETNDVVKYCKNLILNENAQVIKKGKNWYITVDNYVITVNASSFTIITAHTT